MIDPRDRPPQQLEPMVAALARHQVEWVLIGSQVLALYGADLVPNDLDVLPELSPTNLQRLAECLNELGAVAAEQLKKAVDKSLEIKNSIGEEAIKYLDTHMAREPHQGRDNPRARLPVARCGAASEVNLQRRPHPRDTSATSHPTNATRRFFSTIFQFVFSYKP